MKNVLPFSYVLSNNINICNSELFFDFIGTPDETIRKIQNIEKLYRPVWSVKIKKDCKIEYEIYFYHGDPVNVRYSKENTITTTDLDIPESKTPSNYLFFSIDSSDKEPNFFYYKPSESTEKYCKYFSVKNDIVHNNYVRCTPTNINNIMYSHLINKKFINFDINENIKTIYIGDKQYRNYIGVYYDGVTWTQLKTLLEEFNVYENYKFVDKYKQYNFSISIDYRKIDFEMERIGIYGILY